MPGKMQLASIHCSSECEQGELPCNFSFLTFPLVVELVKGF